MGKALHSLFTNEIFFSKVYGHRENITHVQNKYIQTAIKLSYFCPSNERSGNEDTIT